MSLFKTYHQVNRENKNLSFGITPMEEIYERHAGKVDEPHRHNYYTVLIVRKAHGEHRVDFKSYPLHGNAVYFIAPGQVHQVIEKEKSIGYSIVFSSGFLARNNIAVDFIENLNLFHDFGESPPLALADVDLEKLLGYAAEMVEIYMTPTLYQYDALGALLKLMLIHCNKICDLGDVIDLPTDSASSVLMRFRTLVNEHYRDWHATSQYAEALHITPDYLNRIVKTQTGKTAKQYIQSRITVAAKRLLYFSSLSLKEMGYELGFSEPANFSAFFKNCTGMAPSAFRDGMK